MEAFRKEIPDARLRRGLEEWQNYESTLVALLKQSSRAAPHLSIRGFARGFPEIAERLMCAVLIIRKLRPDVSAYEEVERLLANPSLLPDPVRVSEKAIRELRAGTIQRPITWSEWNYLKEGRDIPMRRYTRSVKAIQRSVARLKRSYRANTPAARIGVLEQLYAEYLWSQKFQAGFSEAEAAMLRALVPTEEAVTD